MKFPPLTPASARVAIMLMCFILILIVLGMLIWVPALRDNDLFKMLAQAIIIQGFFGLIVAFYFTAKDDMSEHIYDREHPNSFTPDRDLGDQRQEPSSRSALDNEEFRG